METYLQETPMLDFSHPAIHRLVSERDWKKLPEFERIQAIYNFVRDEIRFGYNTDDSLPASRVLADGYGQCNTKATLFMALLRCCAVPCRIHGFTIDKRLQKGAMTGLVYALAPGDVFHSWAEVYLDGVWYCLEGLILDRDYLTSLQKFMQIMSAPFSAMVWPFRTCKTRSSTLTGTTRSSRAWAYGRISAFTPVPTTCSGTMGRKFRP